MPDSLEYVIALKHAAMTDAEIMESARDAVRRCIADGRYPGRDQILKYGARGRNARVRWAISVLKASGEIPERSTKKKRQVAPMAAADASAIKIAMISCIADGLYPSCQRLRWRGARGNSTPMQVEINRLIATEEVVIPIAVLKERGLRAMNGEIARQAKPEPAPPKPRKPRAGKFGESVREILRAERGVRRWRTKWLAEQEEKARQEATA